MPSLEAWTMAPNSRPVSGPCPTWPRRQASWHPIHRRPDGMGEVSGRRGQSGG